ncbi:MAG TPA: hypothetical protein VFB16_15270 [Bauldia sp.]|nr:hypothetical protein [Bauldia sp.]
MAAMTSKLKELVERAEAWPESAQAELVELGLEIEAEQQGVYHASADELAAIDQALAELDRGEGVSQADAEAIFAKLRRA